MHDTILERYMGMDHNALVVSPFSVHFVHNVLVYFKVLL